MNLSGNNLTSLPESISDLTGLRKIFVFGNQLNYIPSSICDLDNIVTFKISNNNLCDRYFFECLDDFYPQDQSKCCRGKNGRSNWINCP